MKKAIKATLGVAAGAVALAGVASIPVIVSAWGDNSGNPDGRPEYTIEQINNGALGDTITFNSISDGVIGHEFNFVGAREDTGVNAGADNVWYDDIAVEDGKTYVVRLYVHNNSPRGYDAVATDTHVSFSVPSSSDDNNRIQVVGFINSPDASPTEYWDHVNFKSDYPFHLEYVTGSALLENHGVGSAERNGGQSGVQISDAVVNAAAGGIRIGYDSVDDGRIPGCFDFDSFVTVRLKAVYDTPYKITKTVRPAGTTGKNWVDQLEVNVGDTVEYQIEYENTSNENQYNVMIRDLLPSNLEYVAGSTRLWNEEFTGATVRQDDLVTERAINIGNYAPGANALVRFNAKVVDENLTCGSNTMVNWGQGTVNGQVLRDYANVHLTKVCETPEIPEQPEPPVVETTTTPTTLPTTGPEAVACAIAGTGSVVTAAGYYVASRRSLKK